MFSKTAIPSTIDIEQFKDVLVQAGLPTLPASLFFKKQEDKEDLTGSIPLPEELAYWKSAKFGEGDVLFGTDGDKLYILANSTKFGFALFLFRLRTDIGPTVYKPDNLQAVRNIFYSFKEDTQMSLSEMASQMGFGGMPQVQPMNVDMTRPVQPVMAAPSVGSGITTASLQKQISNEAQIRGYVYGYVMGNAPEISLKLHKDPKKEGIQTGRIQVQESRPRNILSVLVAVPTRCVTRGGVMAEPSAVRSGNVDFNNPAVSNTDMTYMHLTQQAALAYISALGGALPEYAPNVDPSMRQQWDPAKILARDSKVSFVRVVPQTNRKGNSAAEYGFSLKTTSPRRSLFTPNNVMCLKAVEHMSTKISDAKQAFAANEAAFGHWTRTIAKRAETTLDTAKKLCPDQIWETSYEIDGNKVTGIGSVFFMTNDVETVNNKEVHRAGLTYFPWYVTAAERKEATPKTAKSIVKRAKVKSKDGTKEVYKTTPILWKEHADDEQFRPYKKFENDIISQGFITREQLAGLSARGSKKRASTDFTLDEKVLSSLDILMEKAKGDIDAIINESAAQLTLKNATR